MKKKITHSGGQKQNFGAFGAGTFPKNLNLETDMLENWGGSGGGGGINSNRPPLSGRILAKERIGIILRHVCWGTHAPPPPRGTSRPPTLFTHGWVSKFGQAAPLDPSSLRITMLGLVGSVSKVQIKWLLCCGFWPRG